MGTGEAIADIDRHGIALADDLLAAIDPIHGGFRGASGCGNDAAAHQLLWRHYMATGRPACGEAVLLSLRTLSRADTADPSRDTTLGELAQMLELLTWVWRQCRCPELRHQADDLAGAALTRMRVPGVGFATSRGRYRDDAVRADLNGLMLVALIEAGSVLERRDCLVAAREVFDEIVARLDGGQGLHHAVADGSFREPPTLDDHAMMSRAAIRLFEAFGKRRYLERAEAWVARLDEAFRESAQGGYRMRASEAAPAASILDTSLPSGTALMIGVLARLHALVEEPLYADRAERLVEVFRETIKRSGHAAATAVACVQTLARPVSIRVSGDPKLAETRELMRVALDFALPDRLVLGPGAGDPADAKTGDASPRALVRLGAHGLAPIGDAARLRALVSPGGLRQAFRYATGTQDC